MKKLFIVYVFLFIFICVSCNKNENNNVFCSEQIIKTVGNIDIIVDPNVELMMIVARLAGVTPFAKGIQEQNIYLDNIDNYFGKYDTEPLIAMIRKSGLFAQDIPEYGMYLKNDDSSLIMNPKKNKKFIITSGPAALNFFYYKDSNVEEIKKFRLKTNFDIFYNNNILIYNEMIDKYVKKLEQVNFGEWIKDFYGLKEKNNLRLYLTYLGGNFGIQYIDPKKGSIPSAVICVNDLEYNPYFVISHEFSHPNTKILVEKLYKNEKIKSIFDEQYFKYSPFYDANNYSSGKWILNETINQACANKFIANNVPDYVYNYYQEILIKEMKYVNITEITDFLDNYENNRKKFKTLDDFYPELEEFLCSLGE